MVAAMMDSSPLLSIVEAEAIAFFLDLNLQPKHVSGTLSDAPGFDMRITATKQQSRHKERPTYQSSSNIVTASPWVWPSTEEAGAATSNPTTEDHLSA
ncbi:hypothetical protein PIB30_084689 [Stylosanthes scabra]|uniref:Uncharacterized protein n=1 Tax=Stylosanthes scabra TaxID=79078 RepID=A0ABU6TTE5_9FABA|nr:hypothetical protein [Stylosanthes scabra]